MVTQARALRMPTTRKAFWFSLSRISYFDGLQFADARLREQPLPPTAVIGFRSEAGHIERSFAGIAKDRPPAANIDADCALISFKEMPITPVHANHETVKVTRGEIGGLAVERAALVNDFERRQNPALVDLVEFD
jgi:hypothetical protein